MSAISLERYNDFGKTSYINQSYIHETFCVESVGQYISDSISHDILLQIFYIIQSDVTLQKQVH